MNSFFKIFFACLLAIIVSSVVTFFASVAFITILATSITSLDTKNVEETSVLHLTLSEYIVDDPGSIGLTTIDPINMKIYKTISLASYTSLIEKAASDPNIEGIYIEPSTSAALGTTSILEIRQALERFKQSGKFVVGYAESYTLSTYFLASIADKLFLSPVGGVDWVGMASQTMFYKGTLQKLGIEPEIIRHGKYKSAVEPFTNDKMSYENRKQIEELLGSVWGYVVGNISAARDIDSTLLQNYASNLKVNGSQDALNLSMVDQIGYSESAKNYISELVEDESVNYISIYDYSTSSKSAQLSSSSPNKIAIIYIDGEIISGSSSSGVAGSNTICKNLAKARKDDDIKGVVLRINSPGGSALAADVIWNEVELLQQKKPVIVSMGAVAASGGYYVAAPADVILAQPTTITGSIGVFGVMFNAEKGLKDKLGITVDVVKTNKSADMGSFAKGLSNSEREYMTQSVENIYDTFVSKVAKGRNLSIEQVEQVAGGRVWSGLDAKRVGLVDGFGSINHAVMLAADRAGVASSFTIDYLAEKDTFSEILELFTGGTVSVALRENSFTELEQYKERVLRMNGTNNIQALMPYTLEIE